MIKKPNYYREIIQTLNQLHKDHPSYNIGKHLSTASDGCTDLWGITDKELLSSLKKYKEELDVDVSNREEEDIETIIKDGMNLGGIFSNDIEEEEEY